MIDPYDLERFVTAQSGAYAGALAELRAGRKRGHWIWFVLPQLRGLGSSAAADRFGISGVPEAVAYLRHRVLGPRLVECARAIAMAPATTATELFGPLDALKVRSCLTLFEQAALAIPDRRSVGELVAALERYYDGIRDPLTLERLAQAGPERPSDSRSGGSN